VSKVEGQALRPGTLVNVDFGGFADQDGLFVPTTALRTDHRGQFVLVVAGGKAERRDIETAPVHPGTVAVRGGLEPSADVILDPGLLAPGEAVVPLPN
jgi:membrane fusion protein, multidrug efflux system